MRPIPIPTPDVALFILPNDPLNTIILLPPNGSTINTQPSQDTLRTAYQAMMEYINNVTNKSVDTQIPVITRKKRGGGDIDHHHPRAPYIRGLPHVRLANATARGLYRY